MYNRITTKSRVSTSATTSAYQRCATPIEALMDFFINLSPKGRSSRADFWWVMLFVNFPHGILTSYLWCHPSRVLGISLAVFSFFLIWADYCLFTRRAHDSGRGDVRSLVWLVCQVLLLTSFVMIYVVTYRVWISLVLVLLCLNFLIMLFIAVVGLFKSSPCVNEFGPVPHCEFRFQSLCRNSFPSSRLPDNSFPQSNPRLYRPHVGIFTARKYVVPFLVGVVFCCVCFLVINTFLVEKDRYIVIRGEDGVLYRTNKFTGETDVIKGTTITRIKNHSQDSSRLGDSCSHANNRKWRILNGSELSKLSGSASPKSGGFYSGTIYNGNSDIHLKEITVNVFCLENGLAFSRDFTLHVDIAPFASGEFSIHVIRNDDRWDQAQWNNHGWHIESARGCNAD